MHLPSNLCQPEKQLLLYLGPQSGGQVESLCVHYWFYRQVDGSFAHGRGDGWVARLQEGLGSLANRVLIPLARGQSVRPASGFRLSWTCGKPRGFKAIVERFPRSIFICSEVLAHGDLNMSLKDAKGANFPPLEFSRGPSRCLAYYRHG